VAWYLYNFKVTQNCEAKFTKKENANGKFTIGIRKTKV